jgi:thymidine kinase
MKRTVIYMKSRTETIFISGSMFGQKSKKLIDVIKIAKEQKGKYLVLKPANDTRDGLFVKSRDYDEKVPAVAWDKDNFIKQVKTFGYTIRPKIVFIDEVHFLSLEDIKYIHKICSIKDIILIASGLETDFRQKEFPAATFLKMVNTRYSFNHGICNSCEKNNAEYNVLFDEIGLIVKDGDSIQPGSDQYGVYCKNCFENLGQ